ncbi:MAG TPA: acyltransferase [Ktedonobacterales bacterium]|nr:acyltransferase [Ktedonobacterales bacterium]
MNQIGEPGVAAFEALAVGPVAARPVAEWPTKRTQAPLATPAAGAPRRTREHLYEIDLIRSATAICVVGVHAVAFTVILAHSDLGALAQNAVVSALHFTREIFLSITAFVMVYGYANRPFSFLTFWRKRGLGVLVPYVLWSLFYEAFTKPPLPPGQWLLRALNDIGLGDASFQLYFILLSIEFYLVLPWFLRFITWAGRRPWLLLGVSFAVQLILLYVDYSYIERGPFAATAAGKFINLYQGRFLPVYQLNLVCGGLAALYMRQVRAFLLRYGAWSVLTLALGLGLLWGNLLAQVDVTHLGIGYGIDVFQPGMAVYATALAVCFYWVAYRWSIHRAPQPPRASRFWALLSDVSFGIYLIHAYILIEVMQYVTPSLPLWAPEPLRVLFVWGLSVVSTVAICVALLYIPWASRLIGRPWALQRDRGVGRWLIVLWLALRRGSQRLAGGASVYGPAKRPNTQRDSAG